MIRRSIKFREPMDCQNGHFRWLFKERIGNRLDDYSIQWGPKHPDCNCPTQNTGQGFSAIGVDLEYSGLQDCHDKIIWEWDIVRLFPSAVTCYIVEFKKGMFGIQLQHEGFRPLGTYPEREVIGNIYENIEIIETAPSIQAIVQSLIEIQPRGVFTQSTDS